jgi:hypothetical protein
VYVLVSASRWVRISYVLLSASTVIAAEYVYHRECTAVDMSLSQI